MSHQRRIPAQRSQSYLRWSLPAVGHGDVVKVVPRLDRDPPAPIATAEVWQRESLEDQLIENIKAGRHMTGVSARQLEAIVREAAREGRDQGYNEGFVRAEKDGYEHGRAEGMAAARGITDDAARRFAGLIEAMMQPLDRQDQELRQVMLDMVVQIARAVIRTELVLQPESIATVISEAVGSLPLGTENVRVFVCESDLTLMRESMPGNAAGWSLLVDAALEPGDCRVESSESLVSYTVSERFESLLDQMLARLGEGQ